MTNKKAEIIKNTLGSIAGILVIVFIVWASSGFYGIGKGSSVESCTGNYLTGKFDLKTLKEQCPNLSKEKVIEDVNSYFENNQPEFSGQKQALLDDINSNF